jgi:Na+/melibiose symporter-like transporter
MNTGSNDSGLQSDFSQYFGDSTKPPISQTEPNPFSQHVVIKLSNNIDGIKEDVKDIKHKIETDSKMIIADIAMGILSSFIVSILFLFITMNVANEEILFGTIKITSFILLIISMFIVGICVHFITKKRVLRNQK